MIVKCRSVSDLQIWSLRTSELTFHELLFVVIRENEEFGISKINEFDDDVENLLSSSTI